MLRLLLNADFQYCGNGWIETCANVGSLELYCYGIF